MCGFGDDGRCFSRLLKFLESSFVWAFAEGRKGLPKLFRHRLTSLADGLQSCHVICNKVISDSRWPYSTVSVSLTSIFVRKIGPMVNQGTVANWSAAESQIDEK